MAECADKAVKYLTNAAEHACELLEPALVTLTDLIADDTQTGAVRVSASKLIIDTALKLDARALMVGRQERQLAELDEWLGVVRDDPDRFVDDGDMDADDEQLRELVPVLLGGVVTIQCPGGDGIVMLFRFF